MRDLEDEARIKAYMAAKMAHIKMYNECMNLADGLDVEKFAELVRADEREKVAHEAMDRMVAENQKMGLYDDGPAVKTYCGGKPNYCTTEVTPEVIGEVTTEVPCKTHPDAPHGFNRNASFDEDRYVCDCEFWEPDVDNVDMSKERVHKSDKSIHEPAAIVNSGPYTKNDTTAGVLHKEWVDRLVRIMGTFDLATGHADTMDQALDSLEQELSDVLGHLRARREWVGLSEDEFEKILETHNEATPFAVYLNIEQALKEKNT